MVWRTGASDLASLTRTAGRTSPSPLTSRPSPPSWRMFRISNKHSGLWEICVCEQYVSFVNTETVYVVLGVPADEALLRPGQSRDPSIQGGGGADGATSPITLLTPSPRRSLSWQCANLIADELMTKQICTITQNNKLWDNCFYLCANLICF